MRRAHALLAAVLLAAVGLALALSVGGGRSPKAVADKRPPNPMTPKIVACERSGKVICDLSAYRRDRREGLFALSKPDRKGAHLLTLPQVLPPAWRHQDYAAELMTYGQAKKLAPGLAGASSAVVDPSRKTWVLTLYHRPPIRVVPTWGPCCSVPRKITVRVESQTVDATTGDAMDSCVNCVGVRESIRYQPEGVTLMTPLPGYHPSLSRRAALALFRRSGIAGSDIAGHPTVRLWTVRDVALPRGGYPAWVVTFPHTSPTSYGIGPVRATPDCAWVAIYNLRARVWTQDFQNCPDTPSDSPTCDSGCTPANQSALDDAAEYARHVAGAAQFYTGASIDDAANKVVVYLTHAPQSVIDRLDAAHPGIYVIHNDAPRTAEALGVLENRFDFNVLQPEGIRIVSVGPSVDGYLDVGVTSKVAEAQRKLDAVYGPNVVRVSNGSLAIAWSVRARSGDRS